MLSIFVKNHELRIPAKSYRDLIISPDPSIVRNCGRASHNNLLVHTLPRAPLPNEVVIDKPGKGSFYGTDLEMVLHLKGIKNLVLVGITTDVYTHDRA